MLECGERLLPLQIIILVWYLKISVL